MRLLFLGEALLDLICARHVRGLGDADHFVPKLGGVMANAAVTAARSGGSATLVGGIGDDEWGRWLRARLVAAGVDCSLLAENPGYATPLALVAIDAHGEPRYSLYGDPAASPITAVEPALASALAGKAALVTSSNMLVGERERSVTMRAIAQARQRGLPVVIDPNLRLHRWPSAADAVGAVIECVAGAFLVRCNAEEAEMLTGERDAARAAQRLCELGASSAIVSLGAAGAVYSGPADGFVPAPKASVISTVGAGDALLGALVAHLGSTDFDPASIPDALQLGLAAAAQACGRWGATD